jgi:hypothetical protein
MVFAIPWWHRAFLFATPRWLSASVSPWSTARLAATAAITALVVHFGMYYGGITHYHNNPAVPATFALIASTLVMAAGVMMRSKD